MDWEKFAQMLKSSDVNLTTGEHTPWPPKPNEISVPENPASQVKVHLSNIEQIAGKLRSLKGFDGDIFTTINETKRITKKMVDAFLRLSTFTNKGKSPDELKGDRLKSLKKWVKKPVPSESVIAFESDLLDQYVSQAGSIINKMQTFPELFKGLKDRIQSAKSAQQSSEDAVYQNSDALLLEESDLLALAAKKQPTKSKTPPNPKPITGVVRSLQRFVIGEDGGKKIYLGPTINVYNKYFAKAESLVHIIEECLSELETLSIDDKLIQDTTIRNVLLKKLVSHFSAIKSTIINGNFQNQSKAADLYQKMLREHGDLIPNTVIKKLEIPDQDLSTTDIAMRPNIKPPPTPPLLSKKPSPEDMFGDAKRDIEQYRSNLSGKVPPPLPRKVAPIPPLPSKTVPPPLPSRIVPPSPQPEEFSATEPIEKDVPVELEMPSVASRKVNTLLSLASYLESRTV